MNGAAFARGSFLGSVLLALAMLTFLAHIVPPQFSAHSPFTTSADSHGPTDSVPEASHIASCDAAMSRPAPTVAAADATIALAAQSMLPLESVAPTAIMGVVDRPSRYDTGPALFLLHASFLI